MKISTKLRGSAVLIIGGTVIFVGAVLYVSVKTRQAGERNQIAQKILETSVTGLALRIEYGLTGEERPKVQWYALQTIFNKILDQATPLFTKPANQTLLVAIRDKQGRKKVTFDAVVSTIEQGGNPDLVARLNSRLAVMVQEEVNIATRLSELNREEHSALHKTLNAIVGVLGLFVILFALISHFVSRKISSSLATLQQEFTRIASLDFSSTTTTTTTTGSNDEIGQLARAFNKMVGKLKKSYGSLEEKVRERTITLAKAKAKDEAILASIGDGIVVVDKEGKIIYVNQSFEEMVGWKAQEVFGKYIVEVVPREDEKGNVVSFKERILPKVLSGEKVIVNLVAPFYYICKNKSRFPAMSIITPIVLDGKILGAVETFRDITREKNIDKAKTEFVSLASHQLRTPLSTISWYSEMLLAGDAGKLNDEQKKYLDEVYKSNHRMIEMVNALLNVSRLELGTFVIEPEPTDVVELVRSVLDEQKPQIDEKKIKLSPVFEKNIPLIQADPKLLQMVFQNLLSNAVKYTPEKGEVIINIALQSSSLRGGQKADEAIPALPAGRSKIATLPSVARNDSGVILIKVSDTGYGIPKNQQEGIFTKLFRADNVRAKDTEGTGLGLYIVKSIIEHSGGKVWFESVENKGTTFYVTLPLSGMQRKQGIRALS